MICVIILLLEWQERSRIHILFSCVLTKNMRIVFGVKKVRIPILLKFIRLLSIFIFIEAEDIAIKRIKFIPCFMEKPPFPLEDWLQFLVGGNVWVDFSEIGQFDTSFTQLIGEITAVENRLATYPRKLS